MKKLLCILLLLPFLSQAQSTQTSIQKQIDSSIRANKDSTIFPVNQIKSIQSLTNPRIWNASIVNYDYIFNSATVSLKASNDVIALTAQANVDRLTIVALSAKVDALIAKIAAGLIITGTAK